MFAGSNGLDPTAFPSLLKMENDLVALAGGLLDAPDGFAGSATSGGTESILLAVREVAAAVTASTITTRHRAAMSAGASARCRRSSRHSPI